MTSYEIATIALGIFAAVIAPGVAWAMKRVIDHEARLMSAELLSRANQANIVKDIDDISLKLDKNHTETKTLIASLHARVDAIYKNGHFGDEPRRH